MKAHRAGTTSAFAALLVAIAVLTSAGCPRQTAEMPSGFTPFDESGSAQKLMASVASNLNNLEDFERREGLPLIRDHLNEWVRLEQPAVKWKVDGLIKTLPPDLRELSVVETLGRREYSLSDARFLEQAVWCRDIGRTVASREGASQFDKLALAARLFDWTVRNIQLTGEEQGRASLYPGEILLSGRGSAAERAWIFILLARQQQIDVVMLALADEVGGLQPWVPAALVDKELYLFEPALGLPIPSGQGSQLVGSRAGAPPAERPEAPATLNQVRKDATRLRSLDVDSENPYPVSQADLKHLEVMVAAEPPELARRMKVLESKLVGRERVTLAVDASALGARAATAAGLKGARLWTLPFEVWRDRMDESAPAAQRAAELLVILDPRSDVNLFQARELHFKGEFDGQKGAKKHYMSVRLSSDQLEAARANPNRLKRTPHEKISDEDLQARLEKFEQAKQDASYWLALAAFEQRDFASARDFFGKRILELSPDGPWAAGARYNLARCLEAEGETAKAIDLYRGDTSLQGRGNQLRARWLEQLITETPRKGSSTGSPAEEKSSAE